MSELTSEQEHAIAIFKANMHFPKDGYHALIIELSKTYQLPFQQVRKVLMKAQTKIEKKLVHQFENITNDELTKESWLDSVNNELQKLAEDNTSVMQNLEQNINYQKALSAIQTTIQSEDEREIITEYLYLAYEKEVFKPLLAMLRTSPLYWKLMRAEEIMQMTPEHQQNFQDYPQYMEGANTLYLLEQQVRAAVLK
ncbi:hypothetical protein [Vibrio superstes]|uniref:Uncharacterized protein n=1 Tax=Vibrio superstes NBRC 103154 TaxID=1219062 RepID=A0A511QKK4_9VIBR|nr:hypothetical protein [Vibrio superstes]GEM77821.1 hypothetical protein VSU01S_00660 [Vibrio superstes NBRC 103154]